MVEDKLKWMTNDVIFYKGHTIHSIKIKTQYNNPKGIIYLSKTKYFFKSFLWPLIKLRADFFVDGFIEWNIGKWIKEYLRADTVFLEIGCGDMSLARYLPKDKFFNAIDMSFLDFNLDQIFKKRKNINLALASATKIPLKSNSASLIVSTEVLEHIPNIDQAIKEIHRVSKPDAIFICSIPNNYGYLYKKYPHPQHVNNWTFEGFKKYLESKGFTYLNGMMAGVWVPLPQGLVKTSYHLPIKNKSEYYNTNFFYVFKINK